MAKLTRREINKLIDKTLANVYKIIELGDARPICQANIDEMDHLAAENDCIWETIRDQAE